MEDPALLYNQLAVESTNQEARSKTSSTGTVRQIQEQEQQVDKKTDVRLAPDYFDQLRAKATSLTRIGNIDVITTTSSSSSNNNTNEQQETFGFCHLVLLFPLTRLSPTDGKRTQLVERRSTESVTAFLQAIRDLNTGNGNVVKEVEGLNERCKIRFTAETSDSELSEITAVNSVLDLVARIPSLEQDQKPLPCAFLGASRSAVSMPTSIITGILGYPQVSPASTSTALNDRSQYPLFGRSIPSDDGTSIPAIEFLRNKLNVMHFGILYANDSYGSEFARSLQKTVAILAPDMTVVPVEIPAISATQEDFENAISALAFTNFRYFFAIIFGEFQYNGLMMEAYRQRIAGPGFTWIFSDATFPGVITDQLFEPNSPLAIATQGVSILKAEGGIPSMRGFQRFQEGLAEWDNQVDSEYVDSRILQYTNEPDFEYTSAAELFKQQKGLQPSTESTFLYDATIALGLAACNASLSFPSSDISNAGGAWEGGGQAHFDALMNGQPFQGATGNVVFDPSTGGRNPNSSLFQITNFVIKKDGNTTNGKIQYQAVASELYTDGAWKTLTPFVFSDGTTNIPSDLPPLNTDYMYIGTGLRSGGLFLCAVAIFMSIGFSVWTYANRTGKVVKVSQPIFLHMICFGNFLMAAAIIPLSFDDEIISASACRITCMLPYWLFCLGFSIAMSALCSKTWRLNKLFYNRDMRRMTVSIKEVLKPTVALFVLNAIALTVWTIVSPLEWERTVSQNDAFGRPSQSLGYCTSNHLLTFLFVCGLLNGGALLMCLYQVYRARHISNEFGETNYILAAAAGMVLVSFVGLPVMIIASENPRAHYFVLSCIVFVICTLFLLFIFVPKIQFHRQVVKGEKSMRTVVREFTKQSHKVSVGSKTSESSDGASGPRFRLSNGSKRSTNSKSGHSSHGSNHEVQRPSVPAALLPGSHAIPPKPPSDNSSDDEQKVEDEDQNSSHDHNFQSYSGNPQGDVVPEGPIQDESSLSQAMQSNPGDGEEMIPAKRTSKSPRRSGKSVSFMDTDQQTIPVIDEDETVDCETSLEIRSSVIMKHDGSLEGFAINENNGDVSDNKSTRTSRKSVRFSGVASEPTTNPEFKPSNASIV